VVINQKGIDPPSLDLLARAGVIYSDFFLVVPIIQIIYPQLRIVLGFQLYRSHEVHS
jgi:hypothetical protein